jgi:multiple sugar transport system substrate-binding protein
MWEEHSVWNLDPIMAPFKKVPVTGRLTGYAGAPTQKAAEVQTKYIIVDMYTKAIQGMNPEDSVKAAHTELVKIYGA